MQKNPDDNSNIYDELFARSEAAENFDAPRSRAAGRIKKSLSAMPLAWTISIAVHLIALAALSYIYIFNSSAGDKPLSAANVKLLRISRPEKIPAATSDNSPAKIQPVKIQPDISSFELMPQPKTEAITTQQDMPAPPSDSLWIPADTLDDSQIDSSSFFGAESQGMNVVYVVDFSGSLISGGSYDLVINELANSIRRLSVQQYFHVILFSEGLPDEMTPARLTPASDRAKLRAWEFINSRQPANNTEPLPALTRAFDVLADAGKKRSGKVIFLLTDGYIDRDELDKQLGRLNRKKSVSVNIIVHQQQSPAAIEQLKAIAKANNGTFATINSR